jgi:hypothetical protein
MTQVAANTLRGFSLWDSLELGGSAMLVDCYFPGNQDRHVPLMQKAVSMQKPIKKLWFLPKSILSPRFRAFNHLLSLQTLAGKHVVLDERDIHLDARDVLEVAILGQVRSGHKDVTFDADSRVLACRKRRVVKRDLLIAILCWVFENWLIGDVFVANKVIRISSVPKQKQKTYNS